MSKQAQTETSASTTKSVPFADRPTPKQSSSVIRRMAVVLAKLEKALLKYAKETDQDLSSVALPTVPFGRKYHIPPTSIRDTYLPVLVAQGRVRAIKPGTFGHAGVLDLRPLLQKVPVKSKKVEKKQTELNFTEPLIPEGKDVAVHIMGNKYNLTTEQATALNGVIAETAKKFLDMVTGK